MLHYVALKFNTNNQINLQPNLFITASSITTIVLSCSYNTMFENCLHIVDYFKNATSGNFFL